PHLLPYLEQNALAQTVNFKDSYACASQLAIRKAVLTVLACPSDTRGASYQTYGEYSTIGPTGVYGGLDWGWACQGGPQVVDVPDANRYFAQDSSYWGSFGDGYTDSVGNPYGENVIYDGCDV